MFQQMFSEKICLYCSMFIHLRRSNWILYLALHLLEVETNFRRYF